MKEIWPEEKKLNYGLEKDVKYKPEKKEKSENLST